MSKNFDLKLNLKTQQENINEIKHSLDTIADTFGKKFSSEISASFDSLHEQSLKLMGNMEKFTGVDVDPSTLKMFSQEVERLAKASIDLSKGVEVELGFAKETEEVKRLQTEIDKTIKLLDKANEGREKYSHASTSSAMEAELKKQVQKQFVDADYLKPGENLGKASEYLRQNLVNVKPVLRDINKSLEELYNKRNALNEIEKRSAKQTKELKTTEKEIAKLVNMRGIINDTENSLKTDSNYFKHFEERAISYKEKLEDLNAELAKVKVELGSQPELQDAQTVASSIISKEQDSRMNLKVSQKLASAKKQEEVDPIGGISEKNAQAINALVAKYFSLQTVMKLTEKAISNTLRVIGELDEAFISIAVVTQYSTQEVWGMHNAFQSIAREAGFTTAEIAKVVGEYFRQGESYSNVLLLTEAAAKAAKVAGIDAAESVRYLTSAVRGYNLAAKDAMDVSDKFAALSAASATSYEGLATAMSKVSAQAYASGVEMDNLMGLLATSMEVTQEAPENIGTAFKTIFARMAEIKDYGKVLEDGVDANRIEKALKTVNVQLFDQNKNMRALDDVLLEVGSRWHTLNQSQKAYLATTLAGTRQQTRLLAVFENYERTLENIETSRNSAGATEAQQIKNMQSIEHALNKIKLATDNIITSVSNNQLIVTSIEAIAAALNAVGAILDTIPGKLGAASLGFFTLRKIFQQIQKIKLTDETSQISQLFRVFETAKNKVLESSKAFQATAAGITLTGGAAQTTTPMVVTLQGALAGVSAVMATLGKQFLVLGAFMLITKAISAIANASKNATEQLVKFRANLYEVTQKSNSLEKLVSEYDKLENKIIKTNDDLERQKEILQLIKDMDMEGHYTLEMDGKLNKAAIQEMRDDLKKEEMKTLADTYAMGMKYANKLEKHRAKGNTEIVNAIIETQAILAATGGNLEEWAKLSDEVQYMAKKMVETGQELPKAIMRREDGSVFSGTYHSTMNDETGESQYFGIDGDQVIRLTMDDTGLVHSVEKYIDLINNAEESTISVHDYYTQLKDATGDYYESIADPFKDTLENFQDLTNITVAELRKAEVAFEQTSKHGIELSEEMKERTILALDSAGAVGFMAQLREEIILAGGSMGDVVDLSMQMVDIFDEMTQDQLIDALHSLDSMEKKIYDINEGLKDFNAESLRELIELAEQYPEVADLMIDSIIQTGEISSEVQKQMVAAEKARMETAIENEILQNEARIEMAKIELQLIEDALDSEEKIRELAARTDIDLTENSVRTLYSALAEKGKGYEDYFNKIINLAAQAGVQISENMEGANIQGTLSYEARDHSFNDQELQERIGRIKELRDAQKETIQSQITNLENTNKILQLSLGKMQDNSWNAGAKIDNSKGAKGTKKEGKAAKEAAQKVEEYSGELHKLYVAKKRLELAKWGQELLNTKQSYKEVADEVRGLSGAFDRLSGETAGQMYEDEYGALGVQKKQLENLIEVSKEYQRHLESKLHPSLKGTYTVINGQIIPVSSRYKNLTLKQMKELDEFAKSFNELGKEVDGYTNQLLKAEQAQNEIIKGMYDTIVEYQHTLIDAIKNQEKKQIESFKKIIDANKEYLEERKKLYEKSFEDQDEGEKAASLAEERQKLIEKLADLEAAHDITSIQRREEYRKQLQDLNDEYNRLQLERNREAMMEALSNQLEYQDEIYQKEEEAYQARIESGEWLEARLKEIQDEARIQAMLDQELHQLSVQKLLEYGYITQEQITQAGITNMNITVSELSREQFQIFDSYWKKNRDVIDHMWNGVGSRTGAVELSEKAMDNILQYLIEHSTEMEGKTSTMQKEVLNKWKNMLQKVNEYTKSFNATKLKGPDYSAVTKNMNNMLKDVQKATDGVLKEYKKIQTEAQKTSNAIKNATSGGGGGGGGSKTSSKQTAPTYRGKVTSSSSRGTVSTVTSSNGQKWTVRNDYTGAYLNGSKTTMAAIRAKFPNIKWDGLKGFKTGGTTERTGLHWLDGKPGAPERILSPGANKKFERMLGQLTKESETRVDSNDSDVVDALMAVVEAVYSSSAENAERVAAAISAQPKGKTVLDIANKNGINFNRRGDR